MLLHVTSLPGGRLGREAYEFVDWLVEAGQTWWQVLPLNPPDPFGSPYTSSLGVRRLARAAGRAGRARSRAAEVARFRRRQGYWADDWERYAGAGALADQVRFDREWSELRRYAAERGIRLIGDIPIYVAEESAEVAAHPELFSNELVAGAAPDVSHPEGQLWGQPVYDWRAMRREGFRWWIERFRRTLELVDVARVDHFRGFVAYWAVPRGATSPLEGRWHRGPGAALFEAVEDELGQLPLIAEDLGIITPAVDRLRSSSACSACGSSAAASSSVTGTAMRSPPTRRTRSSTPARTTIRRSREWLATASPEDLALARRRPRRRRASRTTTSSGRSSGSRSRRARESRSCRCRTSSASAPRRG